MADTPDWQALHAKAAQVFRPTVPIDVPAVFAGREEQITRVCKVILQPGQHAILFGERGVGKTSLANVLSAYLVIEPKESADPNEYPQAMGPIISPRVNCDRKDTFASVWRKVLSKVSISKQTRAAGFGAAELQTFADATELLDQARPSPDTIMKILEHLASRSTPLIIIDEFDRLPMSVRGAFADLVKMLSDHSVSVTLVLVGVADSIEGLLHDHESVSRALVQVHMPRMTPEELHQILDRGATTLDMIFELEAAKRIVRMSQGLPHYVHLLGLHATRQALETKSAIVTTEHVQIAVRQATKDAQHSIQRAYLEATRSAHKGNLFADVLLACALAPCDEIGYFTPKDVRQPMRAITGRSYGIPSFAQHLDKFTSPERSRILQVTGQMRRRSYRFRDPLMQPFVIMQGEVAGRLPDDLIAERSG